MGDKGFVVEFIVLMEFREVLMWEIVGLGIGWGWRGDLVFRKVG